MASALGRAYSFLDRHHFTPFAHHPPQETPAERSRWLRMMLAGWLTMGGAILASAALIGSRLLLIELSVIVLLAFPVVWRLHFSEMPRFWPNWITLTAAVALGIVHWRMGIFTGGEEASRMVLSYRTLVAVFYWIMVFRTFAIRTVGDMTQTALPAVSGLLLILIAAPSPVALAGTALVIGGTLAMLAGEHAMHRRNRFDAAVEAVRVRGGRWRPKVNSWVSVVLAASIAAVVLAGFAAQLEPSNPVGRWLRGQLADRLAMLMIRERPMPHITQESMPLGGPSPRPLDRLMLTVRSEVPVLMRTLAYEIYTGQSWERPQRESDRLGGGSGIWRLPAPERFGLATDVTDELVLEVVPNWPFLGALPAPWLPQEITLDTPALRVNDAGIVSFSGHLEPGEHYRVVAAMPSAISATPGTPPPPRVGLEYALQLPEDLPERVKRLAREIAAETRGSPAEIAMALDGYLKTTFEYDLEAPPLPDGADFVDHFLFEARRGWCNHYATAMVVMLRALGIPARLAAGFTAGEYIDSRDLFEIRDQDAHAWVEVFFYDAGWIDFDPTPDQRQPEDAITGGMSGAIGQIAAAFVSAGRWLRQNAPQAGAASLAIVLVVIASVLGGRWYSRRLRPLRRGATADERIVHAYRQAQRWLQRQGLEQAPSLAPWEYHRVASRLHPSLDEDLSELTGQYVRARFGSAIPAPSAAEAAERALGQMRETIFNGGMQEGESAGS